MRKKKNRNNQNESTFKNAYHRTSANVIRGRLQYDYNRKSKIFNTKSDQFWPVTGNRRTKNHGIATEIPNKDLTALASFPVMFETRKKLFSAITPFFRIQLFIRTGKWKYLA